MNAELISIPILFWFTPSVFSTSNLWLLVLQQGPTPSGFSSSVSCRWCFGWVMPRNVPKGFDVDSSSSSSRRKRSRSESEETGTRGSHSRGRYRPAALSSIFSIGAITPDCPGTDLQIPSRTTTTTTTTSGNLDVDEDFDTTFSEGRGCGPGPEVKGSIMEDSPVKNQNFLRGGKKRGRLRHESTDTDGSDTSSTLERAPPDGGYGYECSIHYTYTVCPC
jgi:hypothetical protein